MSKRILLIDPEMVSYLGLRHVLESMPAIEIEHAANLAVAAQRLGDEHFDLVLLEMYGNRGIHAVEKIRREFPFVPLVVFSGDLDSYLLTKATRLGMAGYIDKSSTAEQIRNDIERGLRGEQVWPDGNRKRVNMGRIGERVELGEFIALTRREFDVLKQMCDGLTNRQIAEALSISYETVKEHVQNILQKMAMSDRTQVAVWAVTNNVIAPEST